MPGLFTRSLYFVNDMLGRYPYLVFGAVTLRYRVGADAITWEAEAPQVVAGEWLDIPFETWGSWTGGVVLNVGPADGSARAALKLLTRGDQLLRDQDGNPWPGGAESLAGMMLRFNDPEQEGMEFRVRAEAEGLEGTLNVWLGNLDHTHATASGVRPFAPILDLRPPIKDGPSDPVPVPPKPNPAGPPMPSSGFRVPVHMHPSLPRDPRTAGLQIEVMRMRNQLRLLRAHQVEGTRPELHVVTGVDR